MCGRLVVSEPDLSVFVEPFHVQRLDVGDWQPRFNLAPSQLAPLITNEPTRRMTLARFGLIPSWAHAGRISNRLINARVERVATSKVYKPALQARRGVVPATGYFEWRSTPRGKRPIFVHDARGHVLALAALWDQWHGPDGQLVESFAVLTRPSAGFLADIHSRMPLALRVADIETWLASEPQPDTALTTILQAPADVVHLQGRPVSALANSPRNDGPQCIAESVPPPPAALEERQMELFDSIQGSTRHGTR